MTRPQPDDLRTVELDDETDSAIDPEDWSAEAGTEPDPDRLLIDELPPHWS